MRRLALPLIAAMIALAALAGGYLLLSQPQNAQQPTAAIGGPFTLTSHEGKPFTEKDVAGAPFLVFFGFTHCPDICPATLFEVSQAFEQTGTKGAKLRALFVSVDPERDTADVLKNYVQSFDERIVGLTGTPAQVEAIILAYKAYAKKVMLKDGSYTMDHTAAVYLMDGQGRFVRTLDLKRAPDAVAKDLLSVS